MIFQFSKFSPKLLTYRWDTLYILTYYDFNQKTVAQKLRENVEMTCIGEIVGRFRQTEEIAKQTLGL